MLTSQHNVPPGMQSSVTLVKIVSGGQTGVDRGALDAALSMNFPAGGWCPSDRAAEDGVIPARYPVIPLRRGRYKARTLQNVLDSDSTLIIAPGMLSGGTQLTSKLCRQHDRPALVIDAAQLSEQEAAEQIVRFIQQRSVRVLNVAGPRASGWPGGHAYSELTVRTLLCRLSADADRL
jgi:hypothetical protein